MIESATTKPAVHLGQLKFTVTIKPGGDLTHLGQSAIMDLETPGVMKKAVEDVKSVVDNVNSASQQLQNVEAVVTPLIKNMEVFANLVATLSKVRACSCKAYRQLIYYCRFIRMPKPPVILFSLFIKYWSHVRTRHNVSPLSRRYTTTRGNSTAA